VVAPLESPMSAGLLSFLLVLAVPLLGAVVVYNRLVGLRNEFRNAFAQIDVQLKRRHDLVPGLVEVARAYLRHERQTLEAVTAARQGASAARASAAQRPTDAAAIAKLDTAEIALSGAMSRFFALVEQYPELKADETLGRLTEELTGTENRIGFARQAFNDAVTDFNTSAQRFPANVVATLFGFREAGLLRATRTEAEQRPVSVAL
jgi:LemA protein